MLPGPGQGRALGLLSRALELFGEFQASETPYLNKQARWCLRDHPTQDCPLAFIYTTHIGMCACARMHTRTHTHIHVPRKESCSVEDSLGKAVYKLAASVLPSEPTHSEGKNPLHRTVLWPPQSLRHGSPTTANTSCTYTCKNNKLKKIWCLAFSWSSLLWQNLGEDYSREKGSFGSCFGDFCQWSADCIISGLFCGVAEHHGRKHIVNKMTHLMNDRKHRDRQRKDKPYRVPLSPPCNPLTVRGPIVCSTMNSSVTNPANEVSALLSKHLSIAPSTEDQTFNSWTLRDSS